MIVTEEQSYASFGVCIGLYGPVDRFERNMIGFKLWNDDGSEADNHQTIIWAQTARLEDNGWDFVLTLSKVEFPTLTNISASHNIYGDIGEVPFMDVCPKRARHGSIYYGCFSNDSYGYCGTNRENQTNFCKTQIPMGPDGVQCL
ncbi:hypothetical protein BGX20_002630 [Mortierella sp. AD010]|nr:hypothetical protein BGX20_002630 [Mortierella sp. AD010]